MQAAENKQQLERTRHNPGRGIPAPNAPCAAPSSAARIHYGSKSLRGTQVAALFYTLCGTAKLAGVDPHAYLPQATTAALHQPGTITLPDALLKTTSG